MNPIAVKKLIEHRKVFSEKFIFLCLRNFVAQFFLEIAVFACFCSLVSRILLTSLFGLYLRIELFMLPVSDGQFVPFSLKVCNIYFLIFFQTFQFLLFFSSNCKLFSSMRGQHCNPKNNISTDIIFHRCCVC